ncbi:MULTISPECIES: McrB family protein [Acinetobacter]|uniref:McrB family protein n=1 Tax=Acinetobacter TaxID=469 RepID=UPI00143ADD18|nr:MULTISPECIES: AAA family ATPase [Acinetobacter]MDD0803361.1 AAA family ATPase [Acinetobacter sp. Gutcm_16]NKG39074.1 restriction endonuclease [Acinetobacter johnsonii]
MNEKIYTKEELKGLSEDKILALLAESWGVQDEKIEIWAELPPLGESTYGFILEPHSVLTGERLYYPLKGLDRGNCKIFVSPKDAVRLGDKRKRCYVRCEVELSPESERIKHDNPFELTLKKGSGENLLYLPKEIPHEILINPSLNAERSQFISKAIYDFYHEKAMGDIDKEVKQKQSEIETQISARETEFQQLNEKGLAELELTKEQREKVKNLLDELNAQKVKLELVNEKLSQDKQLRLNEIKSLTRRFDQIEAEMNNKIQRLKSYVADKAHFLKTFEFVDEDDIDLFLNQSKPLIERVDGLSFNEDLNGDFQKAVSYIHAHLVDMEYMYPRHVVENYLTLLRTKDLIILAGDSGSGKTNLVKSFAKVVGGKSIIIPVKPNWTSSEDLLGYYNPLEKKYLATPFLEALIEAQQNPEIPYFICLDEMNLARVEYYFADFLSLLETRDDEPEISLYAESESAHVLSELKAVVDVIQSTKDKYSEHGVVNFIELLKDEQLNSQLRLAFGFSDKDSLIKYHSEIRRMLSAVMTMPSSIKMPANVHIIGAINIDETTHYLSPKILDRAHIMRFESPLLSDWNEILEEVVDYGFDDVSKPLIFDIQSLGYRANYPKFDPKDPFCELFISLNKEFFHKLGIEFGMRTIRQGLNYLNLLKDVNDDDEIAVNNFLLHKVLPKFTFDGNKQIGAQTKFELVERVFVERLKQLLPNHETYSDIFSSVHTLENVVSDAKANDGIVNFWS